MRDLLKRSITLNPAFTESYELLAFIGLVNNEQLDEAISYLQKALTYQPGNQRYALRIAEINARQDKLAEAMAIADKIAKTADDAQIKSDAENLLSNIRRNEEQRRQYETAIKSAGGGVPVLSRGIVEKEPTVEELEKAAAEANIVSINEALRKPAAGETRIIGRIENISCAKQPVVYTIRTDTENFKVSSADFQGLVLNTFDGQSAGRVEVGCDAKIAAAPAVLTYKAKPDPRKIIRGELVAVEFVPKDFRLLEGKELEEATARVNSSGQIVDTASPQNADSQMRNAMMAAMKAAMRKPAAGQRQMLGFIERAECTNKGTFFFFKSQSQSLKLSVASQTLEIRAFTPDAGRVQLGCAMKNVDVPVVVTYKDAADAKTKSNGELVSLEFVPPNFVPED